jgi:hypothetical protein
LKILLEGRRLIYIMGSEMPIPLSHIRVNIALTQPTVLQKQKIDVGMAPAPAYAFLINVLSSLATSGQKKKKDTLPISAIWQTSLSLYTAFPPKHDYKPICTISTNPPKPSHP